MPCETRITKSDGFYEVADDRYGRTCFFKTWAGVLGWLAEHPFPAIATTRPAMAPALDEEGLAFPDPVPRRATSSLPPTE